MTKWIKPLVISTLTALAATLVFLAAASFVVARTGSLPRGSLAVITTLSACFGAFAAGFFSALSVREKGLLLGLAGGALLVACGILATVLVFQTELTPAGIGKAAAILLSGAIGGILGANQKRKVKF